MVNLKYSRREKKGAIFAFGLLAFPILQFCVFYLYINFNSLILAFQDTTGAFTFDNFVEVFRGFFSEKNNTLFTPLLRSSLTWLVSMVVTFPASVLVTYALYKKIPGEKFFRIVFYLPQLIGAIVMTTLYKKMVAADGPIFAVLDALNVKTDEMIRTTGLLGNPQTAFVTILFYGFWTGIGGNIIVLTGALTRVPAEIFESAKIDGAGFLTEFVRLAIPLIWPTLSMLIIFNMSGIFMADAGTFLLGGVSSGFLEVSTMGFEIFMIMYNMSISGNQSALVFGYPAALGFVMTVITIPVVLFVRHMINKHTDDIAY